MVDKNIQLGTEDWTKKEFGNQYFGITIEYGSYPAGEIVDGRPFGEAFSNNSSGVGVHRANGVTGFN